jgi:hypothetical protein
VATGVGLAALSILPGVQIGRPAGADPTLPVVHAVAATAAPNLLALQLPETTWLGQRSAAAEAPGVGRAAPEVDPYAMRPPERIDALFSVAGTPVKPREKTAPPPPPRRSRGMPSAEQWAALRWCESGGNYQAVSPNGTFRGAYQFAVSTWQGVGGTGDPAAASPAEQDHRAQVLYQRHGRSPWPVCGRHLR